VSLSGNIVFTTMKFNRNRKDSRGQSSFLQLINSHNRE
jgi:hypothetical protein